MKKVLYTLNVNGYSKEITAMTYPLMKRYADKIGADFTIINKRKFPGWPIPYEKLQIYELGKNNDWNIYIDSDAVIHPDFFDVTMFLNKNTVMHRASDMAANRFRYDKYFLRDGRSIGSCNWFTIASDWCIDLWHPLDDMTLDQALENITPTNNELKTVITREHLIDDYVLSRNIAKFGLKFKTFLQLQVELGIQSDTYFWHEYVCTTQQKVEMIRTILTKWKLDEYIV